MHTIYSCAFGLSMTVLAGACVLGPRDGQKLNSKSDLVTIAGFSPQAGETLYVRAYSSLANAWVPFDSLTTPTANPFADKQGIQWYSFQKDVNLPQASRFWKYNAKGEPTIRISTSATQREAGGYYTFGSDANPCIVSTSQSQGAGLPVLQACGSGKMEATLVVPCGGSRQVCCRDSKCNKGFRCNSLDECVTSSPPISVGGVGGSSSGSSCTGAGQPCTTHPSECGDSNFLASGTIQCQSGKPVCFPSGYCSSAGGECGGAAGDTCSAGAPCAPGSACVLDYSVNSSPSRMTCKPQPDNCGHPVTGFCWSPNQAGSCSSELAM
ncbi:MAG: hypothetical protein RL385_2287 [Pseudomonadota bacterium]|jgi:hypothetical protein